MDNKTSILFYLQFLSLYMRLTLRAHLKTIVDLVCVGGDACRYIFYVSLTKMLNA